MIEYVEEVICLYEIGNRIRTIREQKGISQREFANRINAKNTTVSNWENGLTRPNVDMLASICSVLEASPDELLGIRFSDEKYTTEEKRLVLQYRNKPELRQAVCILLGIEQVPKD